MRLPFQTLPVGRPNHSFFDYESKPKPDDFLLGYYGNFDPAKVEVTKETKKKGPAAIDAFIEKKRSEYLPGLREKACFNPDTCEICAAGYVDIRTGRNEIVLGTEAEIVEDHFARYEALVPGALMIGWNNRSYDDPLLVAAARRNQIALPPGMASRSATGYRSIEKRTDLMLVYTGDTKAYMKLERASYAAGGPKKKASGGDFYKNLASPDPSIRRGALVYLYDDNVMPVFVLNQLARAGLTTIPESAMPVPATIDNVESFVVEPRTRNRTVHLERPAGVLQPGMSFSLLLRSRPDEFLLGYHGEFNRDDVYITKELQKKGPEAIEEYIEAKRSAYLPDLRKNAMGDPNTTEIYGATYVDLRSGRFDVVLGSEKDIVVDHFARCELLTEPAPANPSGRFEMPTHGAMVGWDNTRRDDPALLAAARRHGVKIPRDFVHTLANGGRYLTNRIDLMTEYTGSPREYQDVEQASYACGGSKQSSLTPRLAELLTADDLQARRDGLLAAQQNAFMVISVLNRLTSIGLVDLAAPAILANGPETIEQSLTNPMVRAEIPRVAIDDVDMDGPTTEREALRMFYGSSRNTDVEKARLAAEAIKQPQPIIER